MKAEEDAWIQVTNHYNAIRSDVAAEMDKAASAKAKGKQRAVPEDEWDIDERDLPEHFRGKSGIELARRLMSVEVAQQDPLGDRLASLEEMVRRNALSSLSVQLSQGIDRPPALLLQLCIGDDPHRGDRPRPSVRNAQHIPSDTIPARTHIPAFDLRRVVILPSTQPVQTTANHRPTRPAARAFPYRRRTATEPGRGCGPTRREGGAARR